MNYVPKKWETGTNLKISSETNCTVKEKSPWMPHETIEMFCLKKLKGILSHMNIAKAVFPDIPF